ncbi:sugar transferase [Pseudomonas sp. R5(2019)]|uniref:sugar transferase n=1 Tax=Pseudomonas sp. R5(2019) TaxID=2697566 RepID=UPI001411FA73|nr:sugar transferase [Pseudomonas sp. R5(2019)]NBA96334.1 sugar transferase [Pseudomonas sp. R5(2019)]
MTGQPKDAALQGLQQDMRLDPGHRMRIDAAIHRQGRGWITGRPGGRPWNLSRTNRVVACFGALVLLVLLAPLLLGLAAVIKYSSPGPIFFVQKRTGFRGRSFGMYKFRTMVVNAEALKESLRHLNKHGADSIDFKIDKDPRVTPIGRWLRRSSLDELPNLINVVKGDMRLVGPRPTSFNAYRYKDSHLARLSIYPGMTGLWQISGRSNIDFDQRVELDLSYIAEQSFKLDLIILLKTPFKVFSGHGAS